MATNTCTNPIISNNVVKITVQSPVNPGTIEGDQTICSGTAPLSALIGTAASGDGNISYKWQSSATGDEPFTDITLANGETYQETGTLSADTWYRRVATSTLNSNACSANSNTVKVSVNPLPEAVAGADRAICLNGSTRIGAEAVEGNTYSWTSEPAGFTSTEANPMVSPEVNTKYILTETNSSTGCTNSNSVTVTVNPLPEATAGADRAICLNSSTQIGADPLDGNTYSWTSDPAGFTSTEANPTVSPTETTKYILTETISATGCSNTNSVTVTVNPLPVVSLDPAGPFCIDAAPVQLNGSPSGGTYSGSGVSETGIFTPSATGDHVITYTYTDENGCTNSASTTITVNPRALLETNINGVIVTANNDGTDDAGEFSVCNTANNVHFIVFNDLNGVSPAVNVKAYQQIVKTNVTAPFCNNCAATLIGTAFRNAYGTVALVDNTKPGTLVMKFQAFVDTNNNNIPDGNECTGDPIIYTVTVNPLTGPVSFTSGAETVCQNAPDETYMASAANSTSITYSVLPAEAGVIDAGTGVMKWDAAFSGQATITATATGLCGTTSADRVVTVNALPEVSAGTYGPVCVDAPDITLAGSPEGGVWSGTGVNDNLFDPSVGTQTLTYTFTDANSCANSAQTTITVNPLPEVSAGTYGPVCVDAPDITLAGSPEGGVWSGTGVNGNLFDPSVGTQTLTYTYTDANSCANSAQTTITVNPLPEVSAGTYGPVCVDAPDITLAGSPEGGVWSGTGVNGNLFDPSVGTQTLTYTYTDANSCANSAQTTITVNPLPEVLAGTYGSVCVDAPDITLAGSPEGGVWSGTGVNGNLFDPSVGTQTLTYTYTDANSCTNSAQTTITVNPLPEVSAGTYGPSLCRCS